jgi:hypothetical protein
MESRNWRGRCAAARHLTLSGFSGAAQCLVEVFDDIGDVFNSDADPDHFRRRASLALIRGSHLPMRR